VSTTFDNCTFTKDGVTVHVEHVCDDRACDRCMHLTPDEIERAFAGIEAPRAQAASGDPLLEPTRVVHIADEPYDVYIGRAGHGQDGTFGNPCVPGQPCPECGATHRGPASTLVCFAQYFLRRVEADPTFRTQVLMLRGKTLGCFCRTSACHASVIATWLNTMSPA
jgi:hypothetical protein